MAFNIIFMYYSQVQSSRIGSAMLLWTRRYPCEKA